MKKKYLFFNLFIFIFLIACSPKQSKENNIKNINFTVDKTHLSQAYQLTDPHAEFVSKGEDLEKSSENLKLLISLGAMESSGLKVKEITQTASKLSIYVDSIYDKDKLKLAIPQAMVTLDRSLLDKPLEDYSFEIINDNGKPLDIKLSMTDAISKVDSYFKLAANVSPDVHLVKKDDILIWDIKYVATFDKAEDNLPLVKFSTQINANDGNIIDSEKTLIANPIDNGLILNIETDNYILYKKSLDSSSKPSSKEELWIYNINTDKSELLFTSDYTINSTQFSPDLSFISLIESNNGNSSLYLIPKSTRKAYKVPLGEKFTPHLNVWKNNRKLILVEKLENKTRICRYDVVDEDQDGVIEIDNLIYHLSYENGNYLFTEEVDKSLNKKIYSTKDFKSLDLITHGFSPEFIGNNRMIYLEDVEDRDTNTLNIYDLDKKEIIYSIEGYIQNFQILSNKYISFIDKEENHNHYVLYGLSLDSFEKNALDKIKPEIVSNSISSRVYYNKNYDLFFLNVNIPFEHKYKDLIYLVDLIETSN